VNILKIRKPGRAVLTALVLGGVVAALSACDRDFTATVSADQTVSGQVTFSVPQETWDALDEQTRTNAQASAESQLATAFPDGVLTSDESGGTAHETVTFTKVSFDEFETAVDDLFAGINVSNAPRTPSSLTYDDGVYRFDAPTMSPMIIDPTTGAPTTINSLSLTFPTAVADSNGTVSGKNVTWDFTKSPDLTELHAVTAAATTPVATPTPTVKPTPALSVAAGNLVKHGRARVGHRVSVTAPKALTAGTTVRYAWTVAGQKVGAAPSYKIRKKQAGKRLAVTVTYTKVGYKAVAKTVSFGKIKR
jgi:hypothetical protein